MRTIALVLAALFLSGCLIIRPRRVGAGKDCPPGHVWSDGKCHDRGKGHDPDKRRGRGK